MRLLACLAFGLGLIRLSAAEEPTAHPDTPPRPISRPFPEYPAALKKQHIIGSVDLQCVIDEDGAVRDIVVDNASREEFAPAAVAAVAKWKYNPATKAGRPCAVKVGIPVGFALGRAELAELEQMRSKETLPPGPPVLPVERVDEWPGLKKEIRPVTPPILVEKRRMGQVVMEFIVDEQGVPRDIHPLVTTDAECSAAATQAIESWRFTAGTSQGKAVRTSLEVTLVFFPENQKASGLRVWPGVRSGAGIDRLPADLQQAKPLSVGMAPPKLVKQVPADYPKEMQTRGQGGRVTVEMIIDSHGRVALVRSVGATNPFFAAMAERAVSQWLFQPAMMDGRAVPVRAVQPMEFGFDR